MSSTRAQDLYARNPDDQLGVKGDLWAGLYLQGSKAEIVVEQQDNSLSLFTFADPEEMREVWRSIEKTIEGEPSDDDVVVERQKLGWVAYHWQQPDVMVLTDFHNLEELVPAAYRWLTMHGFEFTGDVWIKDGGDFSLLQLA